MMCEEILARLAARDIDPDFAASLDLHSRDCSDCSVSIILQRLSRLRAACESERPVFERAARRERRGPGRLRYAALAASVLITALPGIWVIFSPRQVENAMPADVTPSPMRDVFGYRRSKLGADAQSKAAVVQALRWLARHQNADGSWSIARHTLRCGPNSCPPSEASGNHSIGITALSLLPFLGAGHTQRETDAFSGTIQRGIEFLIKAQDESGRIAVGNEPKYFYGHLLAALALIEDYGLTRRPEVKTAAQKALQYALDGQNRGSGWRYSFQSADSDSSVTGWAVQVLRAAELAGFAVPQSAKDGAIRWFDSTTHASGRVGYTDSRIGKVVIPGANDQFQDHPNLTAMSILSRLWIGKNKKDPLVLAGLKHLRNDPPEWDDSALKVDLYYWYHASQALFLFEGIRGSDWKSWNQQAGQTLVKHQNNKGDCRDGSWDPVDRWSCEGGRVYMTALAALILETPYRYDAIN